MSGANLGWAAVLHRLWSSAATITDREQLGDLVLPPLLTLPGALAAWGLRHGDHGDIAVYKWAGLPLTGREREIVTEMAGEPSPVRVVEATRPELRRLGVTRVVLAGFTVPGALAGTIAVPVDDTADSDYVSACLTQVIDATREAIRRLSARRGEEEQLVRDALLAEASLQMDAVLDTAQTMRRVARMTVPAIAEGCLVYVNEDERPVLRSSVHVDMRRLSAALADQAALDSLTKLAVEGIAGAPSRHGPERAGLVGSRTVDVQVLRARGRVIGVLIFLFDRAAERIPPQMFLRDLAYRAALAIDNGELYEQRRREVVAMQQHLLPGRLPAVDGLGLAASYTVGDQVLEVGGDFYDVVVRSDGVVAALIGDVCGRGVDAAALTGMARHTLGTLLQEGVSPARALGRLNTGLRRDGSWRFVTVGVALLRPDGDGVSVQWMSCGHPAPIVMRAGRPSEPGRGGGVPLGVLPRLVVGRSRLRLDQGDTLLMYTDGLTESRAPGGPLFEEAALGDNLERLRDASPGTLVHELSRASSAFGSSGRDDIAMLAIRAEERDRG